MNVAELQLPIRDKFSDFYEQCGSGQELKTITVRVA